MMTNASSVKIQGIWHATAPHIKCFDCDVYGHVVADCPDKIPPSGTPARHRIPILTQDTMIDLHLTIITGTDIGLTGQDPFPTVIDTEVTARVTHREVTPGHITDVHTDAYCTTDTQTHIIIDGIHHIEDLHCTEVFPHIPEITADLDHIPHTKLPT